MSKNRIQGLVSSMLGNQQEPSFTALTSEKLDMIKALNFYANTHKFEDSKRFALKWAKVNMPEIYPQLKSQKDWRFSSYGFVLRMQERGFILDEKQINKIKAEMRLIAAYREEKVAEVVHKKPVAHVNKALETFDYAIDAVLSGQELEPVSYGVNATDNREVIQEATKIENAIREFPEDFKKSTIKPLKAFLKQTKAQLSDTVNRITRQRVKKVVSSRSTPVKEAKNLRHKVSDENGFKGLAATKIIGAKKALVYHASKRVLVYFVADNENGFAASGTTLKNFDPEKSFGKTIRKPEDLKEAIGSNTMVGMKRWLDDLSTKASSVAGRFNEDTMILKVS